jgi:hypothetical protein
MKKSLLFKVIAASFLFLVLLCSRSASAQTYDTLLFDYDNYSGCNACNDRIMFNVGGTNDSFVDNTAGSKYVYELKVKIKLFTCLSGAPLVLKLNGNTVGNSSTNYFCSCNACDSVTFVISSSDIRLYYKYGQTNKLSLSTSGSTGLYIDRSTVYRVRLNRYNYDAGIVSVDSPSVYACKGTKNIVVKVNNNGKKQFTGVDVNWKWNGITQTTATYSGTLDTINGTGNNTAQVKLGSKSFTLGKSDTLIAWTKNPGSITDSLTFNDTIKYIFRGSYSDTLTVGGSSPSFSTITDAVTALITNGICGNTFIKIRPGTYNEQIKITAIPGTEGNNTVTFLSSNNDSSSVVINFSSNSSNNYTVNLNNARNIIFNKITIEALNSSYGTALLLNGSIENVSLKNCSVIGKSTTSTGSNMYTIYRRYNANNEKTNNISIDRSRVSYGSSGIFFDNPYSTPGNVFSLTNSVVENSYYYNLYLGSAKNVTIINNNLDRGSSSLEYGYGIMLYNVSDSGNISKNYITQRNGSQGGILSCPEIG